jgi:hypothetical protein
MVFALLPSPKGWARPKAETKGPIITHAFAVERGKYGYIWKIYLEAQDPNGQMLRKYKRLRGHNRRALHWLQRVVRKQPGLLLTGDSLSSRLDNRSRMNREVHVRF